MFEHQSSNVLTILWGMDNSSDIWEKEKLGQIEWKKQATECFKGRFTYALIFCVLEESFRGGGGGGWGGIKIVELILKTCNKTCVPQVKMENVE